MPNPVSANGRWPVSTLESCHALGRKHLPVTRHHRCLCPNRRLSQRDLAPVQLVVKYAFRVVPPHTHQAAIGTPTRWTSHQAISLVWLRNGFGGCTCSILCLGLAESTSFRVGPKHYNRIGTTPHLEACCCSNHSYKLRRCDLRCGGLHRRDRPRRDPNCEVFHCRRVDRRDRRRRNRPRQIVQSLGVDRRDLHLRDPDVNRQGLQ